MNIYHIKFDKWDYDEYDSFVVIAEDELGAVFLIAADIPVHSIVENVVLLGVSNENSERVVLGSFNRG